MMHGKLFFHVFCPIALCLGSAPSLQSADPPTNDEQRSGYASSIAPWAQRTVSRHYSGGFLGGGAARRGEDRREIQGTWGWDFHGLAAGKKIWLGWWNGRRDQGGRGAYKTDGPRLINRGH
jgi:hypothetical protein